MVTMAGISHEDMLGLGHTLISEKNWQRKYQTRYEKQS